MYRVVWVREVSIRSDQASVECVNTTTAINQFEAQGWEVVCVAPGTNAQTYGGLFVTLRKASYLDGSAQW